MNAGQFFYLVRGYTGSPSYPYLVEARATTPEALIAACERLLAVDEGKTEWSAMSLISSDARIGSGKMFPAKVKHWTHGPLIQGLKRSANPDRRALGARMEAAEEAESSAFVSRMMSA